MWDWIVGTFKKLFGPKGATLIGKDQQAVTASTTGNNSPVVAARGDVYFNMPLVAPTNGDAEVFRDLEQKMADLLNSLREGLAENPFVRDIIVKDTKTRSHNWPEDHLWYSKDDDPHVRSKFAILLDYGLIKELKRDYAYQLTNRLVKYLTK
jgi:hypothetical protein